MKQKIFSKGKGWYISANNYKDKEDKCYINLYFPKGTEPMYIDNGRGFSVKDIDIQEMKFTSYKGKDNESFTESVKGTGYEKNFGATQSIEIDESELPFY